MNVYKFELRSITKSLITWCIVLICTYYFLIAGIYPMFADGMKMIEELIVNMPADYLLVFGLDINNMTGYNGFYSFAYMYIALISGLMATSITLNIFGKEKQCHCQEFLLTKPIKRKHIFKSKLLAVLTGILIFNIVLIPTSLLCFNEYGIIDINTVLAILAITFSQFIFVGISIFIAIFIPKIRSVTPIVATIGLLAFTIEVFINALRIRWLEFLSPLHFFTPKSVFETGGYNTTLSIYAIIVLILCIVFSLRHFLKSDLGRM